MHYFTFQRATRSEWEELETVMVRRMHLSDVPNHQGYSVGCNYRRFGFYTTVVPDWVGSRHELDLMPYNSLSNGLKKRLMTIAPFINKFVLGLKQPKECKGRNYEGFPSWRQYIVIVVFGYKEFEEGGIKMRKYILAVEGQRKYSNEFFNWLEKRQYTSELPNMAGLMHNALVNELRFFDISTFKSCEGQLMKDLSPYRAIDDYAKGIWGMVLSVGRRVLKLNKPPATMVKRYNSLPGWRDKMEIYLLASKDDKTYIDMDYLPRGEMV